MGSIDHARAHRPASHAKCRLQFGFDLRNLRRPALLAAGQFCPRWKITATVLSLNRETPMSKFSGLALNVGATSRMTLLNPITHQPIREAASNEAWIDLHSASATIGRGHDRDMTDKQIKIQRRRLTAEEIVAILYRARSHIDPWR